MDDLDNRVSTLSSGFYEMNLQIKNIAHNIEGFVDEDDTLLGDFYSDIIADSQLIA